MFFFGHPNVVWVLGFLLQKLSCCFVYIHLYEMCIRFSVESESANRLIPYRVSFVATFVSSATDIRLPKQLRLVQSYWWVNRSFREWSWSLNMQGRMIHYYQFVSPKLPRAVQTPDNVDKIPWRCFLPCHHNFRFLHSFHFSISIRKSWQMDI